MRKHSAIGLALLAIGTLCAQNLPPIGQSGPADTDRIAPTLRILTADVAMDTARLKTLAARSRFATYGGLVEVEIDLHPGAVWDRDFARNSFGVETVYEGLDQRQSGSIPYVWARVPPNRLRSLVDKYAVIAYVRPQAQGEVDSTEGLELTGAKANFHAAGNKGKGIRIAVIDLGFDRLADAQRSGRLPKDLVTRDFTGNGMEFDGDSREAHGVGVAGIVYEMAPEAELYLLHVKTTDQLLEAVRFSIENGIRVINHSVGWFNTSFYDGTGRVNDIAAQARSNGILWVNAAGNSARTHFEGFFTDTDDDGWHNLDGQDETIDVRLQKDAKISLYLTWSGWNTRDGDYQIYLLDENLKVSEAIAKSEPRGENDTTPAQMLSATIPQTGTYHIAIRQRTPSRAHVLVLFAGGDVQAFGQYTVAERSVADPASSQRVLTVGAVSRTRWTNPLVESFSSLGPTHGGVMKPDLCAPDGVDSTVYDEGFSGTSAAAPHVAGAAALLWSKFPDASAGDIRNMLEANAVLYRDELRTNSCGAGLLNLPSDVQQPSPELISSLQILEPGPFYPGQRVTARFTLRNRGGGCVYLPVVTVGGRTATGTVIDFPMRYDVTLCAGWELAYNGTLTLPAEGGFHFFATFKGAEGEWNTSISGAGPGNTIDIVAVSPSFAVYGMDGNIGRDRSRLLRIDTRTGAATVVGESSVLDINDIAMTPDGALWGVTESRFYRLNPLTGSVAFVGNTGYGGINGLVADSSGRLYAGTIDGEFLAIDRSDGSATLVGRYGSGLYMSGDMAFAPDGRLYGTSRGSVNDVLIRIDVQTGRATTIGSIGYPKVFGLTFDPSGTLLAVAAGDTRTPQLIRINLSTGAGSLVAGITNAYGLNGLTTGRVPDTWVVRRDDFENIDGWTAQQPWRVTSAASHSPTRSLTDSPNGNYADDTNAATFSPYFSLATANGATLRFWHKFDVEEGYDYCQVWISTDFGENWERVARFTGRTSGWVFSTIDLTRYLDAPNVRVAFQLVSDSSVNADGWYIDDVDIVTAR